jgi:hypothetical protein
MAVFKPMSKAALQAQLDESVDHRMVALKRTPVPLGSREEYAKAIGDLWGEARAHFLAIGRYLMLAKRTLAHGEFEAMIRKDLPFGTHVAYQLREVAEAVDSGRLAEIELPPSYSVVYRLAKLPDAALAAARDWGLVRPNVTRRELEEFARVFRGPSTEQRTALERRRQRILAQQAKLTEELKRIEVELWGTEISGDVMVVEKTKEV